MHTCVFLEEGTEILEGDGFREALASGFTLVTRDPAESAC